MREILRLSAFVMAAVILLQTSGGFGPARAQAPAKQIQLTEKQVQSFIAAQKQMASAKSDAEFEKIAKASGFASLDEHDEVEANILLVFDGIDPQTKAFTEPPILIKRQIEAVSADKAVAAAERKQVLDELNEALKTAKPVQFPSNVELVKKYYGQLEAALQ
jgi:hypothetical protein